MNRVWMLCMQCWRVLGQRWLDSVGILLTGRGDDNSLGTPKHMGSADGESIKIISHEPRCSPRWRGNSALSGAWGGVKLTNSAQPGCSTSLRWEWKFSRKDHWLLIRPEKGRESKVIPSLLWKSVDHDLNQQVRLLNDRFVFFFFFCLFVFLSWLSLVDSLISSNQRCCVI